MKRYVEVFWTPWVRDLNRSPFIPSHILTQQPDPVVSVIAKERAQAVYAKCPAFIDICRNGFVVRSPIDINITLNHDEKSITTDRYGQEFYDLEMHNRSHQSDQNNPFLLSLPPRILFYSKESVEMEQLDLPVLPTPANVKIIPGAFDISKWVRPIEWAIEVDPSVNVLNLKVGDPLFMVRFKTKNQVPVKLIRVSQTPELHRTVNTFINVKIYRPRLHLKKLYELSKSYIESFWRQHK